ncbi:hypothetical protein BD779DRAFT_1510660 [Infundibulicybe gibba]|nr:hypothetical protein BD779DRAFT_1510660 [Infundibulicybe gibba]
MNGPARVSGFQLPHLAIIVGGNIGADCRHYGDNRWRLGLQLRFTNHDTADRSARAADDQANQTENAFAIRSITSRSSNILCSNFSMLISRMRPDQSKKCWQGLLAAVHTCVLLSATRINFKQRGIPLELIAICGPHGNLGCWCNFSADHCVHNAGGCLG